MSKKPTRFSNKNRTERLNTAKGTQYDLIIIGGGITGAGIALDASLRGLKVLLVEKYDFASGTSSKSTKLIHGGLRYLKQLEFGLVRETGLERAVAHNNAPHLVHPEDMLLPIVQKGTFSALTAGLAITVYDWLANVQSEDRKRMLSDEEVQGLEPLLNKDILKSGILYSEYRTDDARLTIEIIKAAVRNGAEAFNYLEVADFSYTKKGKLSGVICRDNLSQANIEIKSKTIVNAAGPWVDKIRQVDNEETETNIQMSKGVHIVIDRDKLNLNSSVYFDVFDGRMTFAIPRGKVVYVGTTDTFYHDDPDRLVCTKEDAEYLIAAVNKMFEIPDLTTNDIKSTWTGLRPLIRKKGQGPSELSRKDEIYTSDSGLITIAGGKLTGFRKMAERVIDLVIEKQKRKKVECITEDYKIHHESFNNYEEFEFLIKTIDSYYSKIKTVDLENIVSAFGKDALPLIEEAQGDEEKLVKAQIDYTIEYEAACKPIDFIERRLGWLYFDMDMAEKYVETVVKHFAKVFAHDSHWIEQNLKECKEIMAVNSLKDLKQSVA